MWLFVLVGLVVLSVILYVEMRRRQRRSAQLIFSTFKGKYILITGAAHGIGRGTLYAVNNHFLFAFVLANLFMYIYIYIYIYIYFTEMALQLASQGANLILWDINSTTLSKIEKQVSRAGVNTGSTVQAHVVDISDEKKVDKSAVTLPT